MTTEELLGYLITHEHTLQMDREEVKINNKKDLSLQENDEDVDVGMTLLIRNFKTLWRREWANSSRRPNDEEKGKEIKRDLKIKEKKENTKDKIQC